jgi:hypothetical protein
VVKLGDEACLGPRAILPMRAGRAYYTIGVTAGPSAAVARDEDISLGAMSLAAATVVADRLPRP